MEGLNLSKSPVFTAAAEASDSFLLSTKKRK